MPVYEHDTETTTYNSPQFQFAIPAGLTVTGVTILGGNLSIPLVLTGFVPPSRKPKLTNSQVIPYIDGQTSYGGNMVIEAAGEIPKLTLEGFMDTPTVLSGGYNLMNLQVGGIRMSYAELIAMFCEGRATSPPSRINPNYFRDPYGRLYNDPLIMDFSASHVEGVPGRTNFTMVLVV